MITNIILLVLVVAISVIHIITYIRYKKLLDAHGFVCKMLDDLVNNKAQLSIMSEEEFMEMIKKKESDKK